MLLAPLKRNILQKCAKLSLIVLLVPGVGAQGGSLSEVCKYGMNDNIGLLINSSRGIIYASMGLILRKPDKRQSKCNRKWKKL
jgi:orotidine-5'-phosphate decarboxylase